MVIHHATSLSVQLINKFDITISAIYHNVPYLLPIVVVFLYMINRNAYEEVF